MRLISLVLPLLVAADPSIVQTPLGKIQGVATSLARHFFGIPYAEPPVGNARFRPAAPKLPWPSDQTLDATELKSACIQPNGQKRTPPSSEDCLFLQVYTPPNIPPSAKLPVFFWIHGGSFIDGSGADYNGTELASKGTVVVTINYRMGPLGYLQSDALKAEDPSWPSLGGMNGLNDALVALQWTRDNIAAFGGDPERITVAGESAGSLTVCLIAVSPLAQKKFRNVVLESGSCIGPWGPGESARGKTQTAAFMASVNASSLADLRALKVDDILASPYYRAVIYSIDEYVIPTNPGLLYASGNLSNTGNFLIGTNTLDTLYGWPFNASGSAQTQAALKESLDNFFGADAASVLNIYPPGTTDRDALGTWLNINADVCNVCPARFLADTVSKTSKSVYLYQFGFNPGYPDASWKGLSGHAMELTSVWEEGQLPPFPYDPSLARQMNLFWASFAQVDKPVSEQPVWPLYLSGEEGHMFFDVPSAPRTGYRKDQCDFWSDYSSRGLQQFYNYVGFCLQLKLP